MLNVDGGLIGNCMLLGREEVVNEFTVLLDLSPFVFTLQQMLRLLVLKLRIYTHQHVPVGLLLTCL